MHRDVGGGDVVLGGSVGGGAGAGDGHKGGRRADGHTGGDPSGDGPTAQRRGAPHDRSGVRAEGLGGDEVFKSLAEVLFGRGGHRDNSCRLMR